MEKIKKIDLKQFFFKSSYTLLVIFFIYANFIRQDDLTKFKSFYRTKIDLNDPTYLTEEMAKNLKTVGWLWRYYHEKDPVLPHFYELAFEITRKISKNITSDQEIKELYMTIGFQHIISKRTNQALDIYRKLLAWNRKFHGHDYNIDTAQIINMIGICYDMQGYTEKAEKLFKRYEHIKKKIGWQQ
jgi:tetratricopeptide (TPR) repeat protein